MYKKIDMYEAFVEGSKEAFSMSITLFPNLLAMILGVNVLINSGFINWLITFVFGSIKIPIEIITLIITKPISGSGALALINTIFKKYGVDSFNGVLASTIQGCTDTTFYVIALYYGSVGIKKTRYAMTTSILGDIVGIVISVSLCYLIFS